ncbi:uncharacterized protein L3040_003285 [Drepanopeziza brunnea f. sp. 'multigermtubi']|uniref:uncharacterized protein n=1 Tax=Drepanopeziza brunnea f. sp. 'multigermtubi' TaxID=698441 RepID=UPI002393BD54|nr:hypothetical protein L3040_003285 [Drepanopeziza brunnea f. sp. 'multigermtubi']
MEAQSLSTCNQCGKRFQRRAHLLRHQQQHSGDRPYSCKFCAKTFKRSDVLRDHFSRCDRRGTAAIPNSLERGRKRHACDECSRLKVKCDNNVPCRKCTEFGRICTKSRNAVSGAASSPEQTRVQSPLSRSTPELSSDRNSIGFLLNCPSDKDFIREFPQSTAQSPMVNPVQLARVMSMDGNSQSSGGVAIPENIYQAYQGQTDQLEVFLDRLEFQNFQQQTNHWEMPSEDDMLLWSGANVMLPDHRGLAQRAFDIRQKLNYAAAAQNPPFLPSEQVVEAIEMVTAENITTYVRLYFRHWHKHAPMVHRATFNPCTAALPLVISVMSIGAMYSPKPDDVARLKSLLDTMECYIYSIPGVGDEYELPGRSYVKLGEIASPGLQQYQLEEVQGAYLIIVLQYWTGNPTARIRVRQQRFPRVVQIFHHLEVLTMQHSPTDEIKDQASFGAWIRKESFIRTGTIAVMLDHAFGIFNNVSPCFQWAELDLPFPSDERFFELSSFEEMVAKSAEIPRYGIKLKDAFLVLFSPEGAESELNALRNLKFGDAQMLMHFLYFHIWSSTFNNPLASLPRTNIPALTAPYHLALRNWRTLWNEIKGAVDEEEWSKLGFQRTAESYYYAVKSILSVFEKNKGRFPPIPSNCEKGSHLKRLLSF